eukprot:308505-Prymnesium_polylepis.1
MGTWGAGARAALCGTSCPRLRSELNHERVGEHVIMQVEHSQSTAERKHCNQLEPFAVIPAACVSTQADRPLPA